MQYFMTGGTGFIGAYAVKELLEAGHRVTVLDLVPNREFLEHVLGTPLGSEVELIGADVTDMPLILRHMKESGAERVVHLAATLSISSEMNPLRTLKVNCEGTINIFEAALACEVSKVVWASSVAVLHPLHREEDAERRGFPPFLALRLAPSGNNVAFCNLSSWGSGLREHPQYAWPWEDPGR